MNRLINMGSRNISFFECIKSWLCFLKRYPLYPLILINFYRAYHNYITMIICFWKRRYPIKAVLKNGKTVTIKNERILYDSINNGDVYEIFLKGQYRTLPVSSAIVIDVGANIADSSIYLVLRGAKSVIAVDPFPHNYMIAKENIKLNKLSEKIRVLLAGC